VNFKNSIIIMTSNVGSHYFKAMSQLGFSGTDATVDMEEESFKEKVREALKQSFKPEFLNRIDEIVIFNALKRANIEKIVDLQVEILKHKLEERGIKVQVDAGAKKYIVENGFDPDFGARPIRRLIQKAIIDQLADKIIKGEIRDGAKVKIGFSGSALSVSV
jgi:ATPases with chaperone activity, ATP-binding subunit